MPEKAAAHAPAGSAPGGLQGVDLTLAESLVLRMLASIDPSPVYVEHLLWAIDEDHADSDVVEAFGPRPRRRALLTALGNLYDHWLVGSGVGGYFLLDAGRKVLADA